jgi:hypothetical protein
VKLPSVLFWKIISEKFIAECERASAHAAQDILFEKKWLINIKRNDGRCEKDMAVHMIDSYVIYTYPRHMSYIHILICVCLCAALPIYVVCGVRLRKAPSNQQPKWDPTRRVRMRERARSVGFRRWIDCKIAPRHGGQAKHTWIGLGHWRTSLRASRRAMMTSTHTRYERKEAKCERAHEVHTRQGMPPKASTHEASGSKENTLKRDNKTRARAIDKERDSASVANSTATRV